MICSFAIYQNFPCFQFSRKCSFQCFPWKFEYFPNCGLKPLMPSAKLRNWEFTKKFTIFSNQRRKKGTYLAKSPTSKSLSLLCEARKESWIRSTLKQQRSCEEQSHSDYKSWSVLWSVEKINNSMHLCDCRFTYNIHLLHPMSLLTI